MPEKMYAMLHRARASVKNVSSYEFTFSAAWGVCARLSSPMAIEAAVARPVDPLEHHTSAGAIGFTPIADSLDAGAEETLHVRSPREVRAERGYQELRDHGRQRSCATSWRDSSSHCMGRSRSPTRASPGKDKLREHPVHCQREALTDVGPRKRCAVSLSGGSACKHMAVKVFPAGPRDNGEVQWHCAACGTEL